MVATATYDMQLVITEDAVLGMTDVSDPTIVHNIGAHKATLDGGTTVDITKGWSYTGNLVAGTAKIDLTALTRSNLPDATFSGLKVKLVKIKCPAANTGVVVFADGAANGYELFGDAAGQVAVVAGGVWQGYLAEEAPTVAGADKEIDVTSGDGDAAFSIEMAAGSV